MASQGIISRTRSGNDERMVILELTEKGKKMKIEAASIPDKLVEAMSEAKMTTKDSIPFQELLVFLKKKAPRPFTDKICLEVFKQFINFIVIKITYRIRIRTCSKIIFYDKTL